MNHDPSDAAMIRTLSNIELSIGEDVAAEVTARILQLRQVRALPPLALSEAHSQPEVWFRLLKAIGIDRPDCYVRKLVRQIKDKRDRQEAEQRISARRRFNGLPAPRRRFRRGESNAGWAEPIAAASHTVPDESPSAVRSRLDRIRCRLEGTLARRSLFSVFPSM